MTLVNLQFVYFGLMNPHDVGQPKTSSKAQERDEEAEWMVHSRVHQYPDRWGRSENTNRTMSEQLARNQHGHTICGDIPATESYH
jgi:hypothetical protein